MRLENAEFLGAETVELSGFPQETVSSPEWEKGTKAPHTSVSSPFLTLDGPPGLSPQIGVPLLKKVWILPVLAWRATLHAYSQQQLSLIAAELFQLRITQNSIHKGAMFGAQHQQTASVSHILFQEVFAKYPSSFYMYLGP